MNMKYLNPSGAFFVGSSTSPKNRINILGEYTVTLGLTTLYGDGSGEQLSGIYVTQSQLEQIRDEIDSYLRNTADGELKLGIADSLRKSEATAVTFNVNLTGDSKLSKEEIGKLLPEIVQRLTEIQRRQSNDTEQKQKFRINPELVRIEQTRGTPDEPYRAIINQWVDPSYKGSINLCVSGSSEEKARTTLDAQFEALVLRCINAEATKSESLSATPNLNNSEKVDDTPASESEKAEPQKTEKNQVFKLNPNRVISRRNPKIKGHAQWEARTTLYFDGTPLEVIASEYMTEERAREALDYKVKRLIDEITD